MQTYLDLLADTLRHGSQSSDRTGTGTRSVFGRQIRFNLSDGFPAISTKRLYFRGVVGELLWFLAGNTNISDLNNNRIRIWDEWASDTGDLGPIYGRLWRAWPVGDDITIDQISDVVHEIRTNPNSRRLIVSAWNPALLPDPGISPQQNVLNGRQALPPCHTLFQFYVRDGKLSCQLYQRSCDIFLGLPFNIASYALLTHMIAMETDLTVGEFIWTGGDVHIYNNHIDQARKQLQRTPKALPRLICNKKRSLFAYDIEDFTLAGYDPHPAIPAKVSI